MLDKFSMFKKKKISYRNGNQMCTKISAMEEQIRRRNNKTFSQIKLSRLNKPIGSVPNILNVKARGM